MNDLIAKHGAHLTFMQKLTAIKRAALNIKQKSAVAKGLQGRDMRLKATNAERDCADTFHGVRSAICENLREICMHKIFLLKAFLKGVYCTKNVYLKS